MRNLKVLGRLALALAVACLATAAAVAADDEKKEPDVIFVPTPQEVVDKMLELAKVKKDDVVYDLGCGDGRIVCTAAKKFGATGIGVDIDPARIKDCKATMQKFEVDADRVEFRQGDALKVRD